MLWVPGQSRVSGMQGWSRPSCHEPAAVLDTAIFGIMFRHILTSTPSPPKHEAAPVAQYSSVIGPRATAYISDTNNIVGEIFSVGQGIPVKHKIEMQSTLGSPTLTLSTGGRGGERVQFSSPVALICLLDHVS